MEKKHQSPSISPPPPPPVEVAVSPPPPPLPPHEPLSPDPDVMSHSIPSLENKQVQYRHFS